MDNLLALLRRNFGFNDFWPGQRSVIDQILAGRDTLAVMPTGSGKSLIYQFASLVLDGVTVCISPLIALMKNQVDFTRGIRRDWATFLNSSLSARERARRFADLAAGRYRLLYIAPERLSSPECIGALERMPVPLLVVDEAHCISFWGHDFRPDYLSIKDARQRLQAMGDPTTRGSSANRAVAHRTLALTATATPVIQDEIVNELGMSDPARIVLGFDRPNLTLEVVSAPTLARKYHTLRGLSERFSGPGIVYTGTRQEAEAVSRYLTGLGIRAGCYHGGMDALERTRVQDEFGANRITVLAATCAFGMGIDKPDIRFIIHWRMPANVETYYQEIGRAGRDGKPAHAVLLFSLDDQDLQARFITADVPTLDELKNLHSLLTGERGTGDIDLLGLQTGLDQTRLRVGLSLLRRVGLLSPRPDEEKKWRTLGRLVREWKRHKFENLKKIVGYGRIRSCRRRYILDHFGETHPPVTQPPTSVSSPAGPPSTVCGNCDSCQAAATVSAGSGSPVSGAFAVEYIRTFLDLIERRRPDRKSAVRILAGSRARSLSPIDPAREPAWARFRDYSLTFLDRKVSFLIENDFAAEPGRTGFGRTGFAGKKSPLELTDTGAGLLADRMPGSPGRRTAAIEEFNRGFDRPVALEPDNEILQSLRSWRSALARKKDVPAYRIFHNSVLEAIARHLPQTLEELEQIRGVGGIKTAKYGPALLKFTRLVPEADTLVLDTFTARFLAAPLPSRLAGRFDAGFTLDFNSRFTSGDWQRTELGQLVHDVKYSSRRDRAPDLARRIARFVRDQGELDHPDILLPVPVSVAVRNFDPMLLVARHLAPLLGIPLGENLVKKTRETKPMKTMTNIVQKRTNIAGAFDITDPARLAGRRVLVIDDLYDTGSTIDELARKLRQAGAAAVYYVALTKTIHRDE